MGFIKLDRELFESQLWLAEPFTKAQAWVDLIAMANYADKTKFYKGTFQKIKRGQIVTSQRTLAERWKWSKSKVANYIRALVQAEMLTTDNTTRWTVLTIVNYAKYQDSKTTKRPQTGPREDHEETTQKPRKGLQEEYKNERIPSVYIPSRADISAYVSEEGLRADPDAIFDYYESVGWEINGKPIKDWRAVCRRWKSYEKPKQEATRNTDEILRFLEERDRMYDEKRGS